MRLPTTILSAFSFAILPSLTIACLGADGLFLANDDCTFTLHAFVDDNSASTVFRKAQYFRIWSLALACAQQVIPSSSRLERKALHIRIGRVVT
ncbi:hypothetical protein OCU04_009683 [Sclerotinia nivalis]|uniref:Secreted protein n=1 Tax=Sclerotinia nivalis TaxID=352851 RepID=A0A9X0AFL7_9HELO|nr:hypothetical protein OCU04_009683 [Sclerotinia nivalis]